MGPGQDVECHPSHDAERAQRHARERQERVALPVLRLIIVSLPSAPRIVNADTASAKIGRPVAQRVAAVRADHYSSDCPMAGHQIESLLEEPRAPEHPMQLLRLAYGI